ncbi:MAG: AAA family ATPase [Actinomycetota bacterium]
MPDYIILEENVPNYREVRHFIQANTTSELIISGRNKNNAAGIQVNEIGNPDELARVLDLIDNLEDEKEKYKVVNQQVTSIYSVQGGVGKTSIAFNIAYLIGKMKNVEVLLIDLNFCEGQGDLASRLNIPMVPNLSVFIEAVEDSPASLWESIISLNKINIDILQPPLSIEQSDNFDLNMLYEVIYSARKKYGYIICDLPNRYDNHVLEALNLSTKSILLLTEEKAAVQRINKFNKFLSETQKKFAVINKVGKKNNRTQGLRDALDVPVLGEISFIERKDGLFGFLDMQAEISAIREMTI